jgi:cystathionine beta-lyase/cystathionine gamma-synthase
MGLLSRTNGNSTEPSLQEFINKNGVEYNNLNCIIFENPSNVADKTQFCQKINTMIDKMGAVISLSTGRPLIVLPLSADRDLIAHRLSKTLNVKILLSFQADSSENIINRINSLP